MIEVEDLIGKPFLDNGRGPVAYDCWGLMIECFRRNGVIVPSEPCTTGWRKLEEPEPNCAVLFAMEGRNEHVGYVLDRTKFIHALDGHTVVIQPLNHLFWRRRIVGYYQWEGNDVAANERNPET